MKELLTFVLNMFTTNESLPFLTSISKFMAKTLGISEDLLAAVDCCTTLGLFVSSFHNSFQPLIFGQIKEKKTLPNQSRAISTSQTTLQNTMTWRFVAFLSIEEILKGTKTWSRNLSSKLAPLVPVASRFFNLAILLMAFQGF